MNRVMSGSEGMRAVIYSATNEASLRKDIVRPEYLLMGLVRSAEPIVAEILNEFGITEDRVEDLIRRNLAPFQTASDEFAGSAFEPAAKSVLESCHGEASALGHNDLRAEHILLALTLDSIAPELLDELNVDRAAMRKKIRQRFAAGPGDTPKTKES